MGSSGIPYYNGNRIAHNAEITSMVGEVQPIVKVYPRTIGAVLRGGGVTSKTLNLNCRTIPPVGTSRASVENFMNEWNEKYGVDTGTLTVDENDYLDCAIDTVNYDPKIINNYLTYDVNFRLGVQTEDTFDTPRQRVPSKLYEDTRGRTGLFVSGDSGKQFKIWHNMDIVRNLENRLTIELYANESSDNSIKFNGGFETIVGTCWMKASGEDQHVGWKQTVGAYIYNIMNGPLGDIGTLYLGGNEIKNCLWTKVTLEEVYPTSARYQLEFIVSLQC